VGEVRPDAREVAELTLATREVVTEYITLTKLQNSAGDGIQLLLKLEKHAYFSRNR
jgi:hypothetical protein